MIYRINLQSKFDTDNFVLEIFGSGDSELDTTITTLPPESLSIDNLEWSFDGLPIGINSSSELKIKWYIDYLPNDFLSILLNPKHTYNFTTELGIDIPYNSGNVYTLYYKNEAIYRGVQLSDMKHNLNVQDKTFEAIIEGLGKFILTRIDVKDYFSKQNGFNGTNFQSPMIYEYANLASGTFIIKMPSKNYHSTNKFIFQKLEQMRVSLQMMYRSIYQKIMRMRDEPNIYFNLPKFRYYKSNYTGGAGNALTDNELYLLVKVEIKGATVGGLVSTAEDGLCRYSVFYDFLNDFATDNLNRLFLKPSGDGVEYSVVTNTDTVTIPYDKVSVNVENYTINQLTVSLEEFESEDVERYEFKDAATRNGEDYPIALIFNNVSPFAKNTKYKMSDIKNSVLGTTENGTAYVNFAAARQWNIYYIDGYFNEARPFQTDGLCATNDGWLQIDNDRPAFDINAYYLGNQKLFSKALIFKKFWDKIGDDKAVTIKFKVAIEDVNLTDYWNGYNKRFYIDLTNYLPYYSSYPRYYYMTKCEIDMQNEVLNCEMLGF